jgi:hypothetical protein
MKEVKNEKMKTRLRRERRKWRTKEEECIGQ